MHRIDTPTAQVDKFGAGKNGFTRGNPQTGVPATALDDDYFDAVQEELVGIVEAAGITLKKTDRAQVLAALKKLFLQSGNNLSEIKDAGPAAIAQTLVNLGLDDSFSGRVIRVKKISTSQLYEWPDDVGDIEVIIAGAGGGGGAGASVPVGYRSAGSGGGGGGSARSRYKHGETPLEIPIEIGAGGQGGVANGVQPTSGGDTKFGDLMTAYGGARAANGIVFQQTGASMLIGNGGGAEAVGGNLFSSRGGSGTPAIFMSNGYESGAGGDSVFSHGAPPLTTSTSLAGIDGIDGAGGGGAVIIENSAGKNGGDGGNGVCLIVEYSA